MRKEPCESEWENWSSVIRRWLNSGSPNTRGRRVIRAAAVVDMRISHSAVNQRNTGKLYASCRAHDLVMEIQLPSWAKVSSTGAGRRTARHQMHLGEFVIGSCTSRNGPRLAPARSSSPPESRLRGSSSSCLVKRARAPRISPTGNRCRRMNKYDGAHQCQTSRSDACLVGTAADAIGDTTNSRTVRSHVAEFGADLDCQNWDGGRRDCVANICTTLICVMQMFCTSYSRSGGGRMTRGRNRVGS